MDLFDYVKEITTNPTFYILLGTAATIFEISPIKISPWSWLLTRIGRAINRELLEKIDQMEENISIIKRDQEEDNAENMRHRILSFARGCRKHEHHDTEEWNIIMSLIKKYETYVVERHIDNGVMEENIKYLRELYHERLINNDFD